MAEIRSWNNLDEEDPYRNNKPNTPNTLSSTREVCVGCVWCGGDTERVEILSEKWTLNGNSLGSLARDTQIEITENQEESGPDTPSTAPVWYDRYHFHDGTERTVNWLLLLDALNFCFWGDKEKPRWTIEYQGETLNGYWAEAAALTRAVEEGVPLWDAAYLSKITKKELAHIFRGQETIPLFDRRLENAREVGRVLLDRYDGQFTRAIEQVGGSSVKLALLLARDFSSFRDIASYRGHEVRFFKRAQLCVADIHGSFGGKKWGAFTDLDQLTAFADYKVPQVLRHLGVIEYHPSLAKLIDNQEPIAQGSEEEVELRAATVWACELLSRELAQKGHPMIATEIDQKLWLLGQHSSEMRPYHRTRTIYY